MTRWSLGLIFPAMLAAAFGSGCAAVSNPIADGIPVRRIPQEMLGRSKADLQTVPLTLLKLKEEEEYRLDKHDVLAVIAGDLFGPENVQPPVNFTDPRDPNVTGESSVGYPVPVRDDGTISMPNARIPPIQVKGLTAREVEVKLRDLLTNGPNSKFFPKPEEGGGKIAVQLLRKRRVVVTVIREDTQGIPVTAGSSGTVTSSARRLGQPVSLEGGHNDLLRALNQTGGPPGLDAKNEVYIYRGQYDPANPTKGQTRVPLKIYPDEPLQISQADITLNEGDIVLIPGRDAEVFYTGGVLGARQVVLPRDYDLDVVQAISLTGGPIVNGGFTQTAFNAQSFASGIGTPSPALCNITRRLNDGRQLNIRIDLTRALRDPRERVIMMPNDLLVVQEKPLEAIDRYFYQVFRFNTTIQSILGESIFQTITSTLP